MFETITRNVTGIVEPRNATKIIRREWRPEYLGDEFGLSKYLEAVARKFR